jgi:hypothetical protein
MMTCKGFRRKQTWTNFKVLSRNFPAGTEKTTKNLSPDSRSQRGDLNPGSPEYEVGVSTTQP